MSIEEDSESFSTENCQLFNFTVEIKRTAMGRRCHVKNPHWPVVDGENRHEPSRQNL